MLQLSVKFIELDFVLIFDSFALDTFQSNMYLFTRCQTLFQAFGQQRTKPCSCLHEASVLQTRYLNVLEREGYRLRQEFLWDTCRDGSYNMLLGFTDFTKMISNMNISIYMYESSPQLTKLLVFLYFQILQIQWVRNVILL